MASETERPLNTVSKFISRALCLEGISVYDTLRSKNVFLLIEYLNPSHKGWPKWYHGGSRAEGTNDNESDMDFMNVIPDLTVHTSQTDPERLRGFVLVLDTSGSPPGFGRVKVMLRKSPGELFLSSEKFVDQLKKYDNLFLSTYGQIGRSGVPYQHGPCVTTERKVLHGNVAREQPDMNYSLDNVHAIQCDQWPVEAKEWITRDRLHNWPTKEVIETISSLNCHVVPIGDVKSPLSHLEWRISFMLGERELVWSFNTTQVQCYVLLKKLLKKFIEPLAPDQLSSYHMKTIIFWLSEEKGLLMWTDANLLMCVTESLNMLKNCIEKGELKHYFHRQRNLLNYKLEDVRQKERVLLKIAEIQEDCVTHVLTGINEREELLEKWNLCYKNMTQFIQVMKCDPELHYGYTVLIRFFREMTLSRSLIDIVQVIAANKLDPLQIRNQIKHCEENPPKGVEPKFIEMTKIYLQMTFGMTYLNHTKFWSDNNLTVDDALIYVERAQHIDSLSGVLYIASFKFNLKQFSSANDIILSVLRQNKSLAYTGICSLKTYIELTLEGKVRQHSNVYLCGEVTLDVILSWSLYFVPYPVQFECAVHPSEIILIHPCVYAYLLLCLGYYHLGDSAHFKVYLTDLEEAVSQTVGGFLRHHALNLLGYCYYLDSNMTEAFRCFSESLQTTRSLPFALNAAVYHIGIMILSVIDKTLYTRKSSREHTETIYARRSSRVHTETLYTRKSSVF